MRRVRLDVVPTTRDMAQLRWYFEDFPSHPYDPAPTLADAARERMSQLGSAMFASLGAAVADTLLDQCLGDGLHETIIEVLGSAGSLPWEMLRGSQQWSPAGDPRSANGPAGGATRRCFRRAAVRPAAHAAGGQPSGRGTRCPLPVGRATAGVDAESTRDVRSDGSPSAHLSGAAEPAELRACGRAAVRACALRRSRTHPRGQGAPRVRGRRSGSARRVDTRARGSGATSRRRAFASRFSTPVAQPMWVWGTKTDRPHFARWQRS